MNLNDTKCSIAFYAVTASQIITYMSLYATKIFSGFIHD